MPEYRLELASRYLRRQFEKGVGRSISKIVAELVTNSDDSYRRLAKQGNAGRTGPAEADEPKRILIVLDRRKRSFRVVDHAEGLNEKDMEEKFVTYGKESGDRLHGIRTRSLFGKGLRDVLFTQKYGQVRSIKEDKLHTCRFSWKKDKGTEVPIVEIKPAARVTEEFRQVLEIPQNGTIVDFILADGVSVPQHEKLAERLGNFYMLRMINSSPYREIVLRTVHAGGKIAETPLGYVAPEGQAAAEIDGVLTTDDGQQVKVRGEILLSPEPLSQGEAGQEERRGGLLILDEDETVLDLTLFEFDEDPNARRIFGTVQLAGAGDYIRRKLNQEAPEEVLTETRDGFDRKHPFYKALRNLIVPFLEPIIARETREKGLGKSSLSEQTRSRHRRALEILNKLYRDMVGKSARVPMIPGPQLVPPEDGITFINERISVQRGVATPTALLINAALVKPEELVDIAAEGKEIQATPSRIVAGVADDLTRPIVKIIHLTAGVNATTGKIAARWNGVVKELFVETTEREVVTPVDGLEFEREEADVRLESRRSLRIFVDISKIPLGSAISVGTDSPHIKVIDRALAVSRRDLVTESVAEIVTTLQGMSLGYGVVSASALSYATSAKVSVVKRERKNGGEQGVFKDYEFAPLDRKVQTLFDRQGGLILVNTRDPVNTRYFGDEPYAAVEKYPHCQVRLADLILNECLQMMVTRALDDGRLDRRFPNNPEIDVWNYVNEKKFEIGAEIHAQFAKDV